MVRAIGKKDKSYVSFQVHTEDDAIDLTNTLDGYSFIRVNLFVYILSKLSMRFAYWMVE